MAELDDAPPVREPAASGAGGLRARLGEVSPRRSFAFLGLGAIAGLLLAGFGLFTAKGTATHGLPPEDVALVNQRPVLRSDFVQQTEAFYSVPFAQTTKAQRQKIVRDMVREELFVQRGLELDLAASDPDVRQALVAGTERQVEADVTAQQPSDAQLRAYYEQQKAAYSSEGTMTVHDLVPSGPRRADAAASPAEEDAVAALRKGGSIDDVSARFGLTDARKAAGEEFYFAAKLHLGPRLFAVAQGLKDSAVAGPVEDGGVPHILVMGKNVPPVALRFEDAREKLSQDYLKAAQQRIEAADETYLRGKADIQVAPEYR